MTTFAVDPASGSRMGISGINEAVWGVLPSPANMRYQRCRPPTFNLNKQSLTSQETREDRQIATFRSGNRTVDGSIPVELGYGMADDLLQTALMGTWTAGAAGTPQTLKAGTSFHSMTFEQRFVDISKYRRFSGMCANTMSIRVAPNDWAVTTFGMVGRLATGLSDTTVDATPDASLARANPYDSFNGVITEGGTTLAVVTALEINLANGFDPMHVLMQRDPSTLNIGQSNCTGTLSCMLTPDLYNKFDNEEESTIEITLNDPDDPDFFTTITLPRIKYSGGEIPAEAQGRIIMNMPFQALRDPTLGTNIMFTRSNPA